MYSTIRTINQSIEYYSNEVYKEKLPFYSGGGFPISEYDNSTGEIQYSEGNLEIRDAREYKMFELKLE